ncbi:MAG: hypothetical protein QOJ64_1633 [Acidobacteriota bacterium]|nr:hypothetical protein [Acidobacteriota bacterium]
MMNSKSRGFFAGVLILTLVAVLAPPTSAFAERHGSQLRAGYELRAVGQESSGLRGSLAKVREIAKTNGYRDGRQARINDRKRGAPSNFRYNEAYRKATAGYSPKLGHIEEYKRAYRIAFARGWNSTSTEDQLNGY